MEGEVLKYAWQTVLTLGLIILFLLKNKGNKKNNPSNYGERIATLEKAVENIEEDIREIKRRLNRK